MVMASIISLVVVGFCFYKLALNSSDSMFVSLLSSIVTAWLSVAIIFIKDALGITVTSPPASLPAAAQLEHV